MDDKEIRSLFAYLAQHRRLDPSVAALLLRGIIDRLQRGEEPSCDPHPPTPSQG